MRDDLRSALLKLERRDQDVARLETRNAYLEGELKLQERHITNTLKEVITLRQQLAKKKPAKGTIGRSRMCCLRTFIAGI
jgi:hypothetical protein